MSKGKYTAVHYGEYLQLDKILNAQHPKSYTLDAPAHDEMLFIIVHQVYELWFRQLLHELESILKVFSVGRVAEPQIAMTVSHLQRMNKIMQLLIDQIRIMETMTPLDFLDFRNYLFPASGFQSFQFRKLEVLLGLRDHQRLTYHRQSYKIAFPEHQVEELNDLEASPPLSTLIGQWLERIPFISIDQFPFAERYGKAVEEMLAKERQAIELEAMIDQEQKESRLQMLEKTQMHYQMIISPAIYEQMKAKGVVSFPYQGMLAALFIHLYRDEPILRMPFELLHQLIDLDELLTAWRYRHAQMVLRMLGKKTGTGGSSGYKYLQSTAEKHHIFSDLHYISTLLIPRSALPKLPEEMRHQLGFYFNQNEG